jgi:lipoprotein-releasing system ATP-binding protein
VKLMAVENLHKTYRLGRVDVPVLRGASMDVGQGEWVAVLGKSGSGKSTLLHLMGGLDRPDQKVVAANCPKCGYSLAKLEGDVCPECGSTVRGGGLIAFRGEPIHGYSAAALNRYRASKVGFVFQFYHLLPELTVLQNVAIAAMVLHGRLKYRGGASVERATELLEAFGLGHRLKHRPAELSGGERQRVAIARALMNQPELLLADEPTGNLDRATGEKILDAIAALRVKSGQTIVMVTHDEAVAARADRVVRLEDGRVAAA